MPLDSRYQIAPSLQEYFVDKDSGLPLTGGLIYFYEDEQRSVPKDVFELSGAPPNYSYTVLPNPVTLSSVGTFQDGSGNDIIPYYFPYDEDGNIQLYYIEVYDSMGVLQFTREGWPNFTSEQIDSNEDVTNFVPNPQFLLHNDIPAVSDNSYHAGQLWQDTTILAPGGWTFERGPASTATDIVTFPRYSAAIEIPTGNPRYAVKIQTTVAGSDTRKDLCLKFPDVNKFSTAAGKTYNFFFYGESLTGSDLSNVQILLRKFYGTGGSPSPTEEIPVTTVTLQNNNMIAYNVPITFTSNANKSLGTNNDDYVQIIIRLPVTGVQTAQFTDFALTVNDEILTSFPPETNASQIDESTMGWLSRFSYDGSDLYLPLVLTQQGVVADHSVVGKIYASTQPTPDPGEVLCDGSQYETAGYSSEGIPYSRLQAKLFNTTAITPNFPLYGTGPDFISAYLDNSTNTNLRLTTNKTGSATAPVNGATSPGIVFTLIHTGADYNLFSRQNGNDTLFGMGNEVGTVTAITAGTSGFSVTQYRNGSTIHPIFLVTPLAAAGLAGLYFQFRSNPGNTLYYVWFTVDGVGVDPAPGGTGIKIQLISTWAANQVTQVLVEALNGNQMYTAQFPAAATIPAGSWFEFSTSTPETFYVWYKVAGAGSDPALPGKVGVEVDLVGTETAAQVAAATRTAINSKYFAVPDLRGLFLRGWSDGSIFDPNANTRWGIGAQQVGDFVGTNELDDFLTHTHTITVTFPRGQNYSAPLSTNVLTNDIQSGSVSASNTTDARGGQQTVPYNSAVNWVIHL